MFAPENNTGLQTTLPKCNNSRTELISETKISYILSWNISDDRTNHSEAKMESV